MWKQVTSNSTTGAAKFRRIARSNGLTHVINTNAMMTLIEAVAPPLGNKKRKKWSRDTEDLINRICYETNSRISNKKPEGLMPEDYEKVPCGIEVLQKIAAKHKGVCFDCGNLMADSTNVKYTAGKKTEIAAQIANDQNAVAEVVVRPTEFKNTKTEIYMERGEQFIRTVKDDEDIPERGIWTGDIPENYSRADLVDEINSLEDRMEKFWEEMQNRALAVSEQLAPLRKWAEAVTDAESQILELEKAQAVIDAKRQALMKELGA